MSAAEAVFRPVPEQPVCTCKGCGGQAARRGNGIAPLGWYGLTVAIPPEMDGKGKGFTWVGQFCSIACLARSVPDLEQQERLAHELYEPARPVGRRSG